jgi:hypothetical protein
MPGIPEDPAAGLPLAARGTVLRLYAAVLRDGGCFTRLPRGLGARVLRLDATAPIDHGVFGTSLSYKPAGGP